MIYPPTLKEDQLGAQLDNLHSILSKELVAYENICKKNELDRVGTERCYVVVDYKVYDQNRVELEKNGFWTTNHLQDGKYVTVISWA